jgi:hypothetical protein
MLPANQSRSRFFVPLGANFFIALFTCWISARDAGAAMIAAPGIDVNDPSWRTPTVLKPLDVDGDNVYGTDGYLLVRFNSPANSTALSTVDGTNGTLNTLPSFLSILTVPGTGPDRMFGAKAPIDDPNNVGGADVPTGVAYRNAGFSNNDSQPYLTLTIGPDVPASGFRLGVLTDNSGVNDPPTRVTLTQTVGTGSDSQSYDSVYAGVQQPDWYFFDILSAEPGDEFVLAFGNRVVGFKPTVSGLTVDVAPLVPEPGCISLCALGIIGIPWRRRRFRQATA